MAKARSILNPELPRDGRVVRWPSLPGSADRVAIAAMARKVPGPVLVICADSREAQRTEECLRGIAPDLPIVHFPEWETLPYDVFSPHADIVSDRVLALYEMNRLERGVLVVPIATAMQRLAPRAFIRGAGLKLGVGDRFDIQVRRRRLEESGYRCVPLVTDHGEFAVRGALFDLFPMGAEAPLRIELFDDEVESIRTFDPETQLSIEKITAVDLLPAREFPFDDDAISAFRSAFRLRFDVDLQRCPVYRDAKNGIASAGIEYYLPLFFEATEGLLDYLPAQTRVVASQEALDAAGRFHAQVEDRYEQRRHDVERPVLEPTELYFEPAEWRETLGHRPLVVIDADHGDAAAWSVSPAPDVSLHRRGEEAGTALKAFAESFDGRVLVVADSPGRREMLADELARCVSRPEPVDGLLEFLRGDSRFAIAVAGRFQGFVAADPGIAIFSERQLHAERARAGRDPARASRDPAALLRDLTDLHEGAPVVHRDYGVGRYQGLTRLDAGGLEGEFLTLEYAQGDKLYVPVGSLDLISRYTGASPETAPLHRLGNDSWDKARRKAAERARDVAAELLEIHARREARKGHAMSADGREIEEFAAGFPFEETPDQLAAIHAVEGDMGAPRPMDRVVCGDVGFGKTEVAMRAAFTAVQAGRQVAVLVPTTLLAQQHFQNFSDRFASWPVKVEVLSRFKGKSQSQSVLDGLASGAVDIVVGTHRLLQQDIRFKQLGLVIVDEEHRFGVRHKEQLKKLRAEVDLLTLTATPIPRTLNMAMGGMRDLSLIATPPARRVAVKTFVKQWDSTLLRDAIQREIQRGGQVYFLHNEIDTIHRVADDIRNLYPGAEVEVAHGQMREKELERIMVDFYRGRFNVLVCTTIIESGIDIPTANTIIINRADRFGLAQLHQLRGRVGRSHHRAYAYLVVPPKKGMTADARKRLEALESLEDLGSGFMLATHDLEIRGAGELLGDEQSGQIQEIGFSLYTELLERSVRALRAGKLPEDLPDDAGTRVDLHLPALIPDDYLPDVHTRLVLYKRISNARSRNELDQLQVEMIDRFGLLPEQVKNLFTQAELKLAGQAIGLAEMNVGSEGGKLVFQENPSVDPLQIIKLVQSSPSTYRLDGSDTLRFRMTLEEPAERIRAAWQLLERVGVKDAA
ncbi:MAG: transcription-repair coupling factor [Pseudomonadota bacterium]